MGLSIMQISYWLAIGGHQAASKHMLMAWPSLGLEFRPGTMGAIC